MQVEERISRVRMSTGVHMRERSLEKSKRQTQEGDDAGEVSQAVLFVLYPIDASRAARARK